MQKADLVALLSAPEDNFLERKLESVSERDIRKTVVAFANSVSPEREAVLFIGVSDNGDVIGCTDPDEKQKKVRRACDDCFPPVTFSCEVVSKDGRSVVAVIVRHSEDRPHFAGPAFIRQGSQSVLASRQAFEDMINSRLSKVAAISRFKTAGVVTVTALQHHLGESKRVSDSGHREHDECTILDCDSHIVRLRSIRSGRTYSEPLDHISLSRDEERHRPKLVIVGY